MGQKIHPIGFRLGISRGWDSTWYGNKFSYSNFVKEDHKIRNKIMKVNKDAGITKIEIERSTNEVSVKIFTSRPGIVIGRGGQRIDELKKLISDITKNKTQLNIEEIRNPDLDATLVSNSIAEQIERRISYKRAARMAASRSMQNGAKGIKIICKGRLAGAEIARKEQVMEGRVPLHTLKADIDYHIAEAHTEYGRIGVKVWIYRGDIEISKQTHVEPSEIKDIELTLTPENSNPSDEKSEIEIIKAEEPKVEEPKVEEPKAAKPKAAKPKAAKHKAEKPKAAKKQPATKKKTTKKTTTKKNKEEASDDTNL
jgi:small subunit ribosomal protein S3